jgi:putative salt-induced outer membrane protein YdiY
MLGQVEVFVRRAILFAAFMLFATGYWCFADQVRLKNGDRFTGTITTSDGKTLVLHTEDAGDLTINWPAIQAIQTDKPLHIEEQDGKKAVGTVTTSDDKLEVATSSGQVAIAMSDVKTLVQESDYEKAEHPSLLQEWKGGVNIGFSLTGGNSQTSNLALGFIATRQTMHDKLGAYANTVYAANNAPGAIPSTTANTDAGGGRYDHDLTERLFGFGAADFFADALQGLNLRSVFGGGLGDHLIKSDTTTLDVLAGLNYTHESYTTLSRNLIALTLGEELMHKLGKSTVLNEQLYFCPDLNSPGDYRGPFNFASVTKLSKWLGWQNSLSDVYVTNPPFGKKQNDVILTTGLNVAFGQ